MTIWCTVQSQKAFPKTSPESELKKTSEDERVLETNPYPHHFRWTTKTNSTERNYTSISRNGFIYQSRKIPLYYGIFQMELPYLQNDCNVKVRKVFISIFSTDSIPSQRYGSLWIINFYDGSRYELKLLTVCLSYLWK